VSLRLPSLTVRAAQRPNSVTHQNNTTSSTRDNSTTISSIETAIAAIELLEPGKQFSHPSNYATVLLQLQLRSAGKKTPRPHSLGSYAGSKPAGSKPAGSKPAGCSSTTRAGPVTIHQTAHPTRLTNHTNYDTECRLIDCSKRAWRTLG
jgi:hypothetical protein